MGKWRNDLGGPGWPCWPVPFEPGPTNHVIAMKPPENSVFLSQCVWNLVQNLVKKAPKCGERGGSPQVDSWQACGFQPSASSSSSSSQMLQTSFYANACRQKLIRRGICSSLWNPAFITARAACHKWLHRSRQKKEKRSIWCTLWLHCNGCL